MNVVVVKYNAGNIHSVRLALKRLGIDAPVSDDPEKLACANKVIFPGQGEAGSAMKYLRERGLDKVLRELKQPFLGICLGLQLMCSYSEEKDTTALGIYETPVVRFQTGLKIPHIGWNNIFDLKGPLFKGIDENSYFYFVHSYAAKSCRQDAALCEYGFKFAASLQQDNFFAVQFHPEKSGKKGEQLIKNFLEI